MQLSVCRPRRNPEGAARTDCGEKPCPSPHRGYSADVATRFDRELHILFIDGDHSYEGCRTDTLAWLPKLKACGIVMLHDYGWAQGIQRVVEEVIRPRELHPGFVFQNTYWTQL